jgi:DNA invertase Pin-like site-specific DNA recombinase
MAVYGYRRVSSDGQQDGSSLSDQTARINALATLASLDMPEFYEDVCSGSIPFDKRKEGAILWAKLKRGDSLIVAKLDRAFRNASDALQRADDLKAMGVDLYLIDMGTDAVTNNGVSRMFFGMLALVAEFERSRIATRMADGREGKKSKGGHIGGKRPFGFDVQGTGREAVLVPREDEQAAIREIVELHRSGSSLRKIVSALKTKGFEISPMTVRRIIKDNGGNRG